MANQLEQLLQRMKLPEVLTDDNGNKIWFPNGIGLIKQEDEQHGTLWSLAFVFEDPANNFIVPIGPAEIVKEMCESFVEMTSVTKDKPIAKPGRAEEIAYL